MNLSVERIREIIKEEVQQIPLEELKWASSAKGAHGKSLWQKLLSLVTNRLSVRAKTERLVRNLLVYVNNVVTGGEWPKDFNMRKYENTLYRLNPDLHDVVGHLFMKIEDLQASIEELNQLSLEDLEKLDYDRDKKRLQRAIRDLRRAIAQDARRLVARRTRRGTSRYDSEVGSSFGLSSLF